MSTLEILQFPDPGLRHRARPVVELDTAALRGQAQDMLETMYSASGIGLAAIQVGIDKRLIVMDISEDRGNPVVLVNPELLVRKGRRSMTEGCLSVPDYTDTVERADRIRYRALKLDGSPVEEWCDGLLATCIQHEIDHLDGRLFIDRLSLLKSRRVRKKLEKAHRSGVPQPLPAGVQSAVL